MSGIEDLRTAVIDAARSHLAEVDNAPTVPERCGTIGRLRETLEDLDEEEAFPS